MGHHYVPQRYLRRFQCPVRQGFVWLYDRKGGFPREAAIDKVAQQSQFYDPLVEAALNQTVEIPANPAIEKLLCGQDVTNDERLQLSLYIATMVRRVPANRLRGAVIARKAIDKTTEDLRKELERHASLHAIDREVLHRRLGEIESFRAKFKQALPPQVLHQIRSPWSSAEMVETLYGMTWRILVSKGPSYFITSDNPAFYFTALGVKNQESEVSFPLSSTHSLHASWRNNGPKCSHLPSTSAIVKELNRRQAQSATRFVFYHQSVAWIPKLFRHTSESLSRITW